MTENQKQVITGLFTAFKGVMFTCDNIPEKKLQDAIKHYAPIQGGEEAVVLYPYSGKEGFLLTTRALYVNQPSYREKGASARASVLVADISDLAWAKGKGLLNPEEYVQVSAGSQKVVIMYLLGEQLMNALNKTIGILQGATIEISASDAAPQAAASQSAAGSSTLDTLADAAGKAKDVADKAKNALGKLGGLFGKK